MDPANLLKKLRKDRGWSLRELEKRTGIANSNLSRMEHGKVAIGGTSAMRLGRAFDVPPEHFYRPSIEPAKKKRGQHSEITEKATLPLKENSVKSFRKVKRS